MKKTLLFLTIIVFVVNTNVNSQTNTVYGANAGEGGSHNCNYGYYAGHSNTANYNTFYGYYAGYQNSTAGGNTFLGSGSGMYSTTGYYNCFLGTNAGHKNDSHSFNVYLGTNAGFNNRGDNNVFIGYNAGRSTSADYTYYSNTLIIANNENMPPLIYGDFANGKIGLGTTSPSAFLHVSKSFNSTSSYTASKIDISNSDNTSGGSNLTGLEINTVSRAADASIIGIKSNASVTSAGSSVASLICGGWFTADLNNPSGDGWAWGAYARGYSTGIVAECTGTSPGCYAGDFLGDVRISNDLEVGGNIVDENGQPYSLGPWNSVTGAIYYNNKVGIGIDAPLTNLNVKNTNVTNVQSAFTQNLTNGGILITTNYVDGSFTPGIFWSTANNNASKPKAGIYLKETGTGTYMFLGTSSSYATGIVNNVVITPAGTIEATEIKVKLNPGDGADFVFKKDYNLRSLQDVETYIKEEGHLPDVPSAKEMEQNGVNLSEQNQLLLQKIEELTLYIIEQEKRIIKQDKLIQTLIIDKE